MLQKDEFISQKTTGYQAGLISHHLSDGVCIESDIYYCLHAVYDIHRIPSDDILELHLQIFEQTQFQLVQKLNQSIFDKKSLE